MMKDLQRAAMAVLALAAALFVPAAVQAQPFDGVASSSLYVPGGDGTRLAVTVFRPTKAGQVVDAPLPVIVTQNRGEIARVMADMRRYTDSGYVWVAQDRRGTRASFGRQTGFVNRADAADGKAVIEWAARQPFSTGKVVALGCSNQAAWQYLAATMKPTGLVAIAPACASPMFFDDGVAIGGIPMIGLGERPYAGECREGNTGARPGNTPPPPPVPVDADADRTLLRAAQEEQKCGSPMLGQYWRNMPRDGMNAFAGYPPALADTAMTDWQAIRDSGIAVFQTGGWFDAAVAGQVEGQRAFGGQLVMGPWVHGNRPPRDVAFPDGARDLTAATLRFFDRHAKGIAADTGPAILYYTIHGREGQQWRSAARWPDLPKSRLYLAPGGGLAAAKPAGASGSTLAPGGAKWFGGGYQALSRWWTGDFAATNAGSLLHTGEPMARDMELTGAATARLWISADRADANVFAMLQDVAPDGSATYVTDGRLRASWRATHPLPWPGATRTWHRGHAADLQPLVPGRPALLEFDFFPVSYVVRMVHRLRLSVTTGTGAPFDDTPPLAAGQPVTLTLHTGGAQPSAIDLPLAPY